MGKQQNWENILLTAKGEKKQNKIKPRRDLVFIPKFFPLFGDYFSLTS